MVKIIAEAGSVHDGSFGNAKKLIELASECGADFIKFQTHIAETETIKNAPRPSYFKDEDRYQYFERTSFSYAQWKNLILLCKKNKIEFMSSPFSVEALKLLIKLNVKNIKIASGEVNNLPLINEISKYNNVKVFLSSGMSNWNDIDKAINILKNNKIVILQCSSIYPCPPEKIGLNVITEMRNKYKHEIGFSDHSEGFAAPFAAAAIGASYIEKHITFSKRMYGSDAKNGMEPDEFKVLTKGLRDISKMLKSKVNKNNIIQYKKMKITFEKSIYASRLLKKNHKLTIKDMSFKKPGNGIPAARYKDLLGKRINKNLKENQKILWANLYK